MCAAVDRAEPMERYNTAFASALAQLPLPGSAPQGSHKPVSEHCGGQHGTADTASAHRALDALGSYHLVRGAAPPAHHADRHTSAERSSWSMGQQREEVESHSTMHCSWKTCCALQRRRQTVSPLDMAHKQMGHGSLMVSGDWNAISLIIVSEAASTAQGHGARHMNSLLSRVAQA